MRVRREHSTVLKALFEEHSGCVFHVVSKEQMIEAQQRDAELKSTKGNAKRAVGDVNKFANILQTLVDFHGQEGPKTKNRRRMAHRLAEVTARSHRVAASGLREAQEEEDDE